jgi:HAD superfamily hydrolase (TIGR01457 family)
MTAPVANLTTYLIDLDGVIYRGEELLPGAKAFVRWLNEQQKKFLFLTNNSFASELQVVEKLQRLGIATDASHVMGAAQAAVNIVAQRFPHGHVYIVGETPLFDMVRAKDLSIANDDPAVADVVLVGLDRNITLQKLTTAILAIRRDATFIAINRDPLLPIAGNNYIAGTGTLVAAIEAGSGVPPKVVGKPRPTFLQEAMRSLNSQPDQTIMIGDNLAIDILAGQAAGTQTLLVLSGNDTRTSLIKTDITPTYVYDDLATLMDEIEE